MRIRNGRSVASGLLLVAVFVAGCGSDAEQNVPGSNIATVAGAGKRIDVSSDIQRGSYPNACALIPNSSMSDLIESPVISDRNVSGCAWTTGRASDPSVQVSWIELGANARDRYDQKIGTVTDRRTLPGVGTTARIYRIDNPSSDNKIVRIDVRKPRVYFRVDVNIVTSSASVVANAEAIGTRVAQLIAQQVN